MKRVSVVLADPPWAFGSRAGGTWTSGSAKHYDTLNQAALERLPVGSVLAPSAVLFLWAVVPQLPEALRVMSAWGFTYKTTFTWIKDYGGKRLGMGFWHRGGTELLLVGVKGNVSPFEFQGPSHFTAPVGKHSAKPAEARDIIRRCVRNMAQPHKLELFGRDAVEGWTVLGNEIDGQDIRAALAKLAVAMETAA